METPIVVAVALLAAVGGVLLGALVRTMWASAGHEGRAGRGPPHRGRGARPARRN